MNLLKKMPEVVVPHLSKRLLGLLGCIDGEWEKRLAFMSGSFFRSREDEKKTRGQVAGESFFLVEADSDQASSVSSVITGPESCPLAETSRSTNSMIAIAAASDMRIPALITRQ